MRYSNRLPIGLALPLALSLMALASRGAIAAPWEADAASQGGVTWPLQEAVVASWGGVTPPLQSRQAVTQTYTLYLPIVGYNACSSPFSYNESLRYNLTIIQAADAWQKSCYQGQGVTVAVVDTGIDLDHPDLQARLVSGKTFVDGTSSADDDYGHGTHVAGIVAAVANNGGVIGVAPEANLMPVKVLDSSGSGSLYDVAQGIEWAADHGADIINLSLGTVYDSYTVEDAVDYAYDKGALVVAAGGNCGGSTYYYNGCDYQNQTFYPGAYGHAMSVAATDSSDARASSSNQGSYIEIAAPGSSVYSTYYGGGYAYMSGTSMATPHVSGLAALIWSQHPTWTNKQVRARIRATAVDLGASGWDQSFGYGRIDAAAAMGVTASASAAAADATTGAAEPPAVRTATGARAAYVPGEILVKFRTGFTAGRVMSMAQLEAANVQVAGTLDQIGVQRWTVTAGQEQAVLAQLRASAGVAYAELNYRVTIQ
jgi:type VII secretion-associated serine protease mycosin